MSGWKGPLIWIATAAIFAGGAYLADKHIPGEHLPWKELDTSRPLGKATKSQILRMALSPPEVCMDLARDTAGFETIPSDPKEGPSTGDGKDVCGWEVARLVYGQDDIVLTPGEANMKCPLSVSTYLWTREIDRLAQERYGEGLAKMHHMGTYSCRRQNGNNSGRWSQHAYGNAWDVASFELTDGHLVSVRSDWTGEDGDAEFLRDIRNAACKVFNVTLSPDYNAAHYDHFHLDMGPSSACR
ncbi:extensin family protein [Litorimonas haliclonae]|uniref:extensin-like domain-containing protein n=1 Tax=Litorimonas haliclonae TaxID=2081977 RepID=UPI0039F02264